MYSKIVWCYVFVLTLLDITLNTKLSAQGKSHGVTVHDSLIEGVTFQEWGKDAAGSGTGARRAVAADALALSPPALHFGRAPLAAAHALTVTLTNTANTTMHLASVAGTTPDFHASFFESKTLPPQANTTFSVVYLGRREGPVSAHLYIHTSLGVHKYPVSAVGVASEWGVWPMVGLRVPQNATAEPEITMYNPTDRPIQVSEVYSSGAWLRLRLPGGGQAAPRDTWLLPPRSTRAIVRLRLQPQRHHHDRAAYIRIKANITGGGLVVCVEARGVPAGEYLSPWQLRLGARGSGDPAQEVELAAGNSAPAGVALGAGVWGAACAAAPPAPPPPDAAPDRAAANGNGAAADSGVYVALLRPHLEPNREPARAARLTFDYAKMWAGRPGAAGAEEAWCAGWVRVGRAQLPYSVRLLGGTLRLLPDRLHVVSAGREEALRPHEVRLVNDFRLPVRVEHVERGALLDDHFEGEWFAPLTLAPGASAVVARLRLRGAVAGDATLDSRLVLHTNVTRYELPVYVYSGRLQLEWEWPNSADGELRLGAVGASSTRRVALRLRNPAPAPLCVAELRAELPGAQLALQACSQLRHAPADHPCRCVGAGDAALAWLTVVAPAREGALRGEVVLVARAAGAAETRGAVSLSVHAGRVLAPPLRLARVAPYVRAAAPLLLDSSMALRMRVLDVTQPAPDAALAYEPAEAAARELAPGRRAVGRVAYAAERLCAPACYAGLDVAAPEGAAWLRRARAPAAALPADAQLQAARYAAFERQAARARNVSLHVHTTHAVRIPASAELQWWWPRLAEAGAGHAGLGGVGGTRLWRLRLANPAVAPLLLQPVVALPPRPLAGEAEAEGCGAEGCAWAAEAFRVGEWRALRGDVREWAAAEGAPPTLLLAPGAELELKLAFAPREARALAAYLYLRNNLTIIEGVPLFGRGVHPSFELGGRRPNSNSPLLFEVSGCAEDGGTVRRTVVARNTGQVGVRLREWRVAGAACAARGFRVSPCAPLQLAPNQSRALHLHYSPDYTLARAGATLRLRTDTGRAAFRLAAAAPARLLPACAARAPRPPWEPALRAVGALLALAALALALAAAALDAERELRRARAARPAPPRRRPLDLRALAQPPPPPPPSRAPARRRRPPRRGPDLDPLAERRAFERWRAEVLRRADPDDERSSEDADSAAAPPPSPRPPAAAAPPPAPSAAAVDGYDADPETEDRPPGSGDEDAASTGSGTPSASSSSSPTADVDEPPREPRPPPEPPRGAARPDAPPSAPDAPRAGRPRREPSDTPRRAARSSDATDAPPRARSATAKHHARKDKAGKRLRSRGSSPARSPLREWRGAGVRWGASWSSVVAAGAPAPPAREPEPALAPIGSDVRRREARAPDHSLFYFNGDAPRAEPAFWRAPQPPPRREPFDADYGSVWGSALEPRGAWAWDVRPPPGFGAARPPPARVYDPFRSLAAIWAPGARDWRAAPPDDD